MFTLKYMLLTKAIISIQVEILSVSVYSCQQMPLPLVIVNQSYMDVSAHAVMQKKYAVIVSSLCAKTMTLTIQ